MITIPILSEETKAHMFQEIKKINALPKTEDRIEAMIKLKEYVKGGIMDDLDDLLAEVDFGYNRPVKGPVEKAKVIVSC